MKAISGVLFLLLKHFKLNHIYQVRSTLTAQKILILSVVGKRRKIMAATRKSAGNKQVAENKAS